MEVMLSEPLNLVNATAQQIQQEQLKSLSLNIDRLNAAPMASAPSRERREPRCSEAFLQEIFGTNVLYFVYYVYYAILMLF